MVYFRYEIIVETTEFEKQKQREALEKKEKEDEAEEEEGVTRRPAVRLVSDDDTQSLVSISKEEVLMNVLGEKQARNLVFGECWSSVDRGRRKHVTFWVMADTADTLDTELRSLGFGAKGSNTVVHVNKEEMSEGFPCSEMAKESAPMEKSLMEMLKMTTGSLTVRSVLDSIKQKSRVTSECLVQLISAAILAGLGLALNQYLLIVASMFLAPFMEAMNLLTFGTRIKERNVIVAALKILLIYTVVVISAGTVVGLGTFGYINVYNSYVEDNQKFRYLPTSEMYERTTIEGIALGILVSAVSALSTYTSLVKPRSDNVHVGNAISLSLVPPLTNTGMFLSLTVISASMRGVATGSCRSVISMCSNATLLNSTVFQDTLASCADEHLGLKTLLGGRTDMKTDFICRMEYDFIRRAGMTFSVTLVNVVMLYSIGMLLLWIARFDTIQLSSKHVHTFYKYDIDYYNRTKTIKNRDPHSTSDFISNIRQQLEERAHLPQHDVDVILESAQRSVHFQSIVGGNRQEMLDSMLSELDDERGHDSLSVPMANGVGFSNGGLRHRPRSRLLSDNQRTLRDTLLRHDFDPHPSDGRRTPVRFYSHQGDHSPLQEPVDEESIGRFHVSASKLGDNHLDAEAVGRFHVAPASP